VQAAQNETATARGVIAALPKDGSVGIVNSDAVSERSAKRVSPHAALLRRQDGQHGSGIDSAVANRARRRIALRLGAKIFLW